ncbi:hypothetical protein D3C81_1075720 [compost metagenome]
MLVRGAVGADGLGHAQHVGLGLVDAQVERHGDVGAHVVAADQAFLAAAVDLQGDQADAHQLGAVQHGNDQRAGEMHFRGGTHVVDDQRHALVDLAIERLEQPGHTEQEGHDGAHDGQER